MSQVLGKLTEQDVRLIFAIDAPCCSACHEGRDCGWEMTWIDVPGDPVSFTVEVCCAVAWEFRRKMKLAAPSPLPPYEA